MTKRRYGPLIALFALASSLQGGAAVAASDPAIRAAIERHVAAHEISGAIVLVNHRGGRETVDVAGASALAGGAPLTADTVVWIASMTKPIVAASVMMLVDEGKLRLEDPVSKYIPAFAATPMVRTPKPGFAFGPSGAPDPKGPPTQYDLTPAHRTLTVRDMITMTGGLQTIGIPNPAIAQITPDDTLASWVPGLARAPLDFEPGTRWAYSNATEYEVLARIVEVISGEPYATFVHNRLFAPLGMRDTSFGVRADLTPRMASLGMMASNPIMMGKFSSGSAGLLSTAADYAKFAEMLRDDGFYRGRRYLKASTVASMRANEIGALGLAGIGPGEYHGLQTRAAPGIKYGYGVAVLTDAPAAGLALPTGAYGWDGVGTRRMWVVPSTGTVIVMLVPDAGPMFGPGSGGPGAAPTHREIESIVAAERS